MDYKYKRVGVPFAPHVFTQNDSSSSCHDQSAVASPTHHKQSSLSLHQPLLPATVSLSSAAVAVLSDVSSSSSAPPTTTHIHSRFPAVGPPRPFSSAQSVRPRIIRAQDDDEDERDDEAGSDRDGFSDTSSALNTFSRSREELDRIRQQRELRLREDERRQGEEAVRLEKVAGVAQKAALLRLRAASAEQAKRKEEEDELRAVVAQVQAREEKQRQEDRARRTKQADQQRKEVEQAEWRQSEERKEDEEKRQTERVKEANMRREHHKGAPQLNRVRRESQPASPPPPTFSSQLQSTSALLPPPASAVSRRPVRSDLLASSLPSNPSYYPTHIHSLLSTAFLPPLSRLFKHYHQRAPSSSASPAYVDMASGVRASVLSSGDWLLMMSECGVSGVLLSKDGLKRVYMLAVRTERKRSSESEVKDDESDERKNGLGLGRFLKSLWCVARSVEGNERVDDSDSGRLEADMRVMFALLEYIRHHATPQRLGAQLKLQWPDMTLREAVETCSRATPTLTAAVTQQTKPVKRREEKKTTDFPNQYIDGQSIASPAPIKPSAAAPIHSPLVPVPATAATAVDDAAERERKERKRLRLRLRVEQYRREQEDKERTKAEDERRKKAEEDDREAERRRREDRLREEEKRRIADFKARRKEEIDELARAEAEKAEREERERKRALELYLREKAERKRREEAEQRNRLLQFHQQLYAQEAAEHAIDDSHQQHKQAVALKEEPKRRQWDKRPPQQAGSASPASDQSVAVASSAYSSPPLASTVLAARGSVGRKAEDDLLSVGGESTGLDSVDTNEEMF